MERIKVIVVQHQGKQLRVAPGPDGFLEIALETDAETVLESVRAYFLDRWKAEVYALQWLFPEDFLFGRTHDQTPHLVVYAKTLGQLHQAQTDNKSPGTLNNVKEDTFELFRIRAESPSQAEPWSLPGWLPDMSAWIRHHFYKVTRISQVRTCPNGAVLRIECGDDTFYLKTQTCSLAYEWALLKILNCRAPGFCPRVLDIRPDCKSHLTYAIRGRPLDIPGELFALRRAALCAVATLQISSIGFLEELRSQDIPYHPLESLGSGLEETLNSLIGLQNASPNRLTQRELENVAQLLTKTGLDFENLEGCGLSETLIHGDLNWSNAYRTETGSYALIDWSLSRVTHPFFTLGSTVFGHLDGKCGMRPEDEALCNAYLEMWSDFASQQRLRAALDAACRLFWIDSIMAVSSLCQPGHVRNLINLPRFLRAALRAYDLNS
jgi:hypothetical protein